MTGGDLQLDKPVSLFLKPVRIASYKDFFGSLSRMFVHSLALDAPSAVTDALDILASLSLTKQPEEIAWTLVNRAMGGALARLLQDNRNNIEIEDADTFAEKTSFVFGEREITIDASLFGDPGQSPVVGEMESILRNWLRAAGLNEGKAASIVSHLRSYFVFALHDEWRKNEPSYRALHEYLKTPFSGATEYEHAWRRYAAYLEKQIHEGVFGETFSLAQLFISPNASYEIPGEKAGEKPDTPRVPFDRRNADSRKAVVNLEECLVEWLGKDDRNDAVRVLRGGPGYGKSSFSKMFAAKQSKLRRVLYLPLHQLELKNDLAEEIGRVCRESYGFKTNPYATEHKLLIIFDGLDELTQQGKVCVELAQQFINELLKKIERKNHSETKLQTIITGRDLVVQSNESNFRKQGQILSMLPYLVTDEEKAKYDDPQGLLAEDKREAWWKKYGELSGKNYPGMPEKLGAMRFDELTAYPILNYLLALNYERGKLSFDKDMNVNTLYADLIDGIYDRMYVAHPDPRPHAAVKKIKKEDFFKILEEIAVSVWHGFGHTATIGSIIARCKDSPLLPLLNDFQKDAEKGIANLLLAFYFQQSEMRSGAEKTFEFTHKSFSEYLIAKRIVRQLRDSSQQYNSHVDGERNECLRCWIDLCGVAALDHDVARFIQNEILLIGSEKAGEIQRFLCEIIHSILERNLPFDNMPSRPEFKEELRQSMNAEQALLVALSACAWKTGEISKIEWPGETSACEWLRRMQKQDVDETPFINAYLNHMDFTGCTFVLMDFFNADLKKTVFDNSCISYSSFYLSKLFNARFLNANVTNSYFEYSILRNSCFCGSLFDVSMFLLNECKDCDFKETKFYNNIFDAPHFYNCNFKKTCFAGNILENPVFTECSFENAQLANNMTKASFNMGSIIPNQTDRLHPQPKPEIHPRR